MTEQQIRDGFERLNGSLEPPLDVHERVTRRVAVRRRRRRASVAAAAALVLVIGVGTAVVLSGGDDGSDELVANDPPPSPPLTMTRPDGSTYTFRDVRVSCEAPYDGAASGPGQRIWATSPRHFENDRMTEPWLYVEAILDQVSGDQTLTYPVDEVGDSDEEPLIVFVADSAGTAERGNEVSNSEDGVAGTVRVLEASCDPTPVLRLEMDMTLGSEVGQGTVDLAGTLP